MHCLLEQIELFEQQRAEIDAELAVLMDQIPQYITPFRALARVRGLQSWPRSVT
jgi:hypothetical protein